MDRPALAFALCCLSSGGWHCAPPSTVHATPPVHPPSAPAATGGEASGARTQPPAPHERMLQLLARSDSVLPPAPPVHHLLAVYNAEAIVPPMCYTRTEGRHNPCYVCHQDRAAERPNRMNDADLQEAYSFSELGTKNHWRNLFEDRSARVAAISDAEIIEWVSGDNYSELAGRLRAEGFSGYVPDLDGLQRAAEAFDAEGFAKDGSHWVAFNYKPLPSTFWPTNGAMDDVMIRLPAPYREAEDGAYVRDVYKANLAILEARIKGLTRVSVQGVNEKAVGEDLDGDGQLAVTNEIRQVARFVGRAKEHFTLPHLYPLDTELLHSVRYVGVDPAGNVYVPPRMKELRYMRKRFMLTDHQLIEAYRQEGYDKELGRLPGYVDRAQFGLDNEMGWLISGFIENRQGRLRFNTYEENLFCMGCHSSIGSTIDNTFSFARKVDGARGWGYIDLRGMPDAPNQGETRGEIATYLERAGGGGEFRSNAEMVERWFSDGVVDHEKVAAAKDVYELITPSRQRALALNKAYRVIVDDQDYIYGRDPATYTPTGTLLLGEEWAGEGRIIEVLNPHAPVAAIQKRELTSIANVSHEGLRFSEDGQTLYFVDEDNSGCIYKFVMRRFGDYMSGQTFVLDVNDFAGDASASYNAPANASAVRVGRATWVPVTNASGAALTLVDPFANSGGPDARPGRLACDELGGTPYGRPEDVEVGKLDNGREVLYFAATSENAVYSVEMLGSRTANVRLAAKEGVTPKNQGFPGTSGQLNSPDNLAQDALGNIYIIEDAPNGSPIGGDVWFLRDADTDGVAESLDHFMTLQVAGSEATGMIFNPKKPTQFLVAVQHPNSTDLGLVPSGFGDAIWAFDLKDIVAPPCKAEGRPGRSGWGQRDVKVCSKDGGRFVRALENAGRRWR